MRALSDPTTFVCIAAVFVIWVIIMWLKIRITRIIFDDPLISAPARAEWLAPTQGGVRSVDTEHVTFRGGAYERKLTNPWWLDPWNPQMFGFGINLSKLIVSSDTVVYEFMRARHVFNREQVALVVVNLTLYGTWIRIVHQIEGVRAIIAFKPKGHETERIVQALIAGGFHVGVVR